MTLSTWQALGLAQVVILLLAGNLILGWLLYRRRRGPGAVAGEKPAAAGGNRGNDAQAPVHRFLESEITRTRAQQENNDRNLPDHVLESRINYLRAELEALHYADTPDPFWAHLCESIDGWSAAASQDTDDDDESLAATHARLQRLIKEMEREPPSQVVVRQLAVIERRLAAIQQHEAPGEVTPLEQAVDAAEDRDAGAPPDSEKLR